MEYIVKSGNGWRVQKCLDGVTKYFGSFDSLEEAVSHRDYCVRNGWSLDCVVRKESYNGGLPPKCGDHECKYIVKYKDRFMIRKSVNGRQEHFGSFRSLDEAKAERDLLEKCSWDLDLLCDLY